MPCTALAAWTRPFAPLSRQLLLVLALLWPALLAAQDWQYRVRPGDNLWDLGARHLKADIGWQRLQQHNRVADPFRLPPGTVLKFPVAWLRVEPAKARLVAWRGAVRTATTSRGAAVPASEGLRLGIGAWLETGDDANATLEFADGSRLLVLDNSRVEFNELSAYGSTGMVDTRMRLQRGRTAHRVTPAKGPASRYIIETPSATSSVRGTRFRVGAGADGRPDTAEVLEGKVQVGGERRDVMLRPGFGTVTGASQAPSAPMALLPAPVIDTQTLRAAALPLTLRWAPVDDAVAYRVEIVRDDAPDVLLFQTTAADPQVRVTDVAAGRLRVLVRGITVAGLQGRDGEAAFTLNDHPLPPLTVAPRSDAVVHQARPRFEWTRSAEAQATVLQVARDEHFEQLLVDTVVERERVRPDVDLAPGRYFWRLASRDAQGRQGPFGQALAFDVSDAPPDPGLENDQAKGRVTLRWQGGEPGQRHHVQVARDAAFTRLLVDEVVDAPQIELDRPFGGRWYIRVQTLDDDGYAAPFGPSQELRFPCRLCYGAGAGAALLLLAL